MRLSSKFAWKLFIEKFGEAAVEKEMPATKKIKRRVSDWIHRQRKKGKDDNDKARVS